MGAYNAYLTIRAGWLGLNPEDRTERALTRMGAMLRLFTPGEGAVLKLAVENFHLRYERKLLSNSMCEKAKN